MSEGQRKQLQLAEVIELAYQASESSALVLPAKLAQSQASKADKLKYLEALLQHDPGVFLERHGCLLLANQRSYFEPLREDYEVDFYLKLLEDQDPSTSTPAVPSSVVKNRRLAQMERLIAEGDFFSEDALRKRDPLLHHQYIGQYSAPRESGGQRGAKLHDRIFDQVEEIAVASKMAYQQRAQEAQEQAEDEEEEEEEGEEENDNVRLNTQAVGEGDNGAIQGNGMPKLSPEERAENLLELEAIMQARFLAGGEGDVVDYDSIDKDASLDEHWAKEAGQDAEDKYFES